jgi:elongation factor 3
LDEQSVAWLVSYLRSQASLTCLIVSHDPKFLDEVINEVIHYESRQLVHYPGNLVDFVALHPEARYYYDLEGSGMQFNFPNPERLDGVNSLTRTVLKMDNVTYTYPGRTVPALVNCSVRLTLGSRVGVVGGRMVIFILSLHLICSCCLTANGAGKSTLIRLLVQELEPDTRGKPL